jgi:hypothetical protein
MFEQCESLVGLRVRGFELDIAPALTSDVVRVRLLCLCVLCS